MARPPVWDQLTDELQRVFAWAQAIEVGGDIGTRSVLIAMIRRAPEASEPAQLLKALQISPDDLFETLRNIVPSPPIDPNVDEPKVMSVTKLVTGNVVRALELAQERRSSNESEETLGVRELFGALLSLRRSTAYRGLALAIQPRMPIAQLAVLYGRYLDGPAGSSFYDLVSGWLREQEAQLDDRSEWQPDGIAREDLLGREHLASALATRLERMRKTEPPESFLIHLDGPWGAGKSSVLHFLRSRLKDAWLVVDFDAWRQSRVGPPWWALLTSLRKAMRDSCGSVAGTRLRLRETVARLRRDQSVAPFVVLLAVTVAAYLLATPGSGQVRVGVALLTAVIASFALLYGLGRGAVAFLMWDSAMGAKRYEQWHKDPMEGLAAHFGWLIGRSSRPVVFFVDDIDRCDEDYVVDLLDSIQTLIRRTDGRSTVRHAPCFVVAGDGRWIRRSYEDRHASFETAVGEAGRPLGYLFLDKIFQLTVDIPEVGFEQLDPYLHRLLGGGADREGEPAGPAVQRIQKSRSQSDILAALRVANARERVHATGLAVAKLNEPAVEHATEHELQKFAGLLERNPRSMKRFVNAYSMALSTMLLEGRDVTPDALALWTLLRLRWPLLAEHLRTHPENVDALHSGSQAPRLPAELSELVRSPAVRDVITFSGGVLCADAVRGLTGSQPAVGDRSLQQASDARRDAPRPAVG